MAVLFEMASRIASGGMSIVGLTLVNRSESSIRGKRTKARALLASSSGLLCTHLPSASKICTSGAQNESLDTSSFNELCKKILDVEKAH